MIRHSSRRFLARYARGAVAALILATAVIVVSGCRDDQSDMVVPDVRPESDVPGASANEDDFIGDTSELGG